LEGEDVHIPARHSRDQPAVGVPAAVNNLLLLIIRARLDAS
jgi:hypothetical protein